MRAIWLKEFGGPDVLLAGDAPDPVAAADEVLIEVGYANITFVETKLRSGYGPFRVELPMIMGNAAGGVVSSVGAHVDTALVGKQVVSSTGGSGAYAEYVAVPADGVVEVPGGVQLDSAVALLADGRTAMGLARAAELRGGDRVLVEAAAGGVGTLLVQLARNAGARVIAAAGGRRKLEVARDLGAEVVVDYREPDWVQGIRAAVGGLDVVFDGVGGDIGRSAYELLDRGGRMLSFGLASGEWADIPAEATAERGVALVGAQLNADDMRALAARADRGCGGPIAGADRATVPAGAGGGRARGDRSTGDDRQDATRGAMSLARSTGLYG